MHTDRQGNTLSGASVEAAAQLDEAVEAFALYRGDPIALADQALAEAADCTMAHIFKAYVLALATEPEATLDARGIVAHVKTLPANERERSHIAALEHLVANNWTAAGLALDVHCMHFPLDIVGLQAGHLIDFYRANTRNLRDRIARVLPKWSNDLPGYGTVLGMYAFGLEETGDYGRAEATGREAVERQHFDCWAHHAVAHVMEMQGRPADGIAWMESREPYWSEDDNLFKVHNWWHKALYHFDLRQTDLALALYEDRIRAEKSAVALDLVDASAFLWRAYLEGLDVSDRWSDVASCWDSHADGTLYPFNDWHAAMAYLGSGRYAEVERLLGAYRHNAPAANETARWARETGLPLIEGFAAFWRGDYGLAIEQLHGARFITNSFGGSHAQRDIIDWTLTEAALRSGIREVAEAFVHERLALKPHSVLNRRFLDRTTKMAAQNSVGA